MHSLYYIKTQGVSKNAFPILSKTKGVSKYAFLRLSISVTWNSTLFYFILFYFILCSDVDNWKLKRTENTRSIQFAKSTIKYSL